MQQALRAVFEDFATHNDRFYTSSPTPTFLCRRHFLARVISWRSEIVLVEPEGATPPVDILTSLGGEIYAYHTNAKGIYPPPDPPRST